MSIFGIAEQVREQTMAKSRSSWHTLERALEYKSRRLGDVAESTIVSDLLRENLTALKSLSWSDGDYPDPGSRLKKLERQLQEAIVQPSSPLRKAFVKVEGKTVYPLLPTKYDLELLSSVPSAEIEGWILADLAVLRGNAGGVDFNAIAPAGRLFQAYVAAISYIANKDAFVHASEKSSLAQAANEARNQANRTKSALDEFSKRIVSLDQTIGQQEQYLSSVVERAKNFAAYKQLYEYFEDKAKGHSRGFGGFLTAFIVLLGLSGWVLWNQRTAVIGYLPSYADGKFELGHAIFVIIPIVASIWIARILLRLAMMNYRLREDASNRQVLIQTLAAIQDNHSELSPEERAVVYSAIFRSSLADQSDLDVSNPTIADIAGMFKR